MTRAATASAIANPLLARLVWIVIGTLVAADLVGMAALHLTLGRAWLPVGTTAMLLGLTRVYRTRGPAIARAAECGAMWIAFTAAGAVLTYLSAATALPLCDAALARVDHALAFDWAAARAVVDRVPVLAMLLTLAYTSLLAQVVLAAVYLSVTGRAWRFHELVVLSAVVLVPTCVISAMWPALGSLAMARPAAADHLHDLLLLRDGGPFAFDLPQLQGIVTMPSYHAVLAVLFAYAFRRTRLFWAVAVLNAVMLVSTIPIGGHYLADVAAGIGLALAAIAGLRHWPAGNPSRGATPIPI